MKAEFINITANIQISSLIGILNKLTRAKTVWYKRLLYCLALFCLVIGFGFSSSGKIKLENVGPELAIDDLKLFDIPEPTI